MFLGLPVTDPSLYVWIGFLPSISKKSTKNTDFYYFITFYDFVSLKTGVNVPSKSMVIRKKIGKKLFFVGLLSTTDEKSRICGTDLRIRICTKILWIQYTANHLARSHLTPFRLVLHQIRIRYPVSIISDLQHRFTDPNPVSIIYPDPQHKITFGHLNGLSSQIRI
jgi:hypothetical protein